MLLLSKMNNGYRLFTQNIYLPLIDHALLNGFFFYAPEIIHFSALFQYFTNRSTDVGVINAKIKYSRMANIIR